MKKQNETQDQDTLLSSISVAIGRLEGKTEVGFQAISNRLDKINGNIDSHSTSIDELQKDSNTLKGKISGVALVMTILGAIIGYLIAYYRG